ncbi:hypothetical protein PG993_007215 [Apiospora rasikravindrae]|uniref:LysM domain-containing protein n=1 Tax=Apiospora rasikravindrae TaxID=990691 RepID=A0ABR1SWV3_9PEZI
MSPTCIPTTSAVLGSGTSTTSCGQWIQATAGDSCWKLSQDHCLDDIDAFLGLNPQLRGDCARVWNGDNYCVRSLDGPVCVVRTLTVVPEPVPVRSSTAAARA